MVGIRLLQPVLRARQLKVTENIRINQRIPAVCGLLAIASLLLRPKRAGSWVLGFRFRGMLASFPET